MMGDMADVVRAEPPEPPLQDEKQGETPGHHDVQKVVRPNGPFEVESEDEEEAVAFLGDAGGDAVTKQETPEKMGRKEWMMLIEAVFEEGKRRYGMFGKVESSFKVRFPIYVLTMMIS